MTERIEKPPVLYEDEAVVVTVKPAGVLSAPVEGKREPSLPELLSPDAPLFVVHRLDRPTAGVMVYAKTAAAASFLSEKGEMEKTYLAVCEGVPAEAGATLTDLLFFDRAKDKSFIVTRHRRGVKEARLSYEVLKSVFFDPSPSNASLSEGGGTPHGVTEGVLRENAPTLAGLGSPLAEGACESAARKNAFTLLSIALDTGRTHQIRAQFSHRKLPLAGDRRYGAKTNGPLGLFAARLSFFHPTSGEKMTFEAPAPDAAPFSHFQTMIGENEG